MVLKRGNIKAFTLIELLIVMGILVILIGLSITVARYSIRRASTIHHMDAARELESALLKFKNENGYVPQIGSCASCFEQDFFGYTLGYLGEEAVLREYVEQWPFDGGTDTTFYYDTDDLGQFFVVCVSLGGIDGDGNLGYYCTGTGIGFVPEGAPVENQNIDAEDATSINIIRGMDDSDWYKDSGFGNVP
jgi:prepilin-type N-terminal cleavage/methylation domain-containing protein